MNSSNKKFDLIMQFLELVKTKSLWDIDELCNILDIDTNEFEYIISMLSEMYISNQYDLFLDIEINNEQLHIEFNTSFDGSHFITDNELISVYKFLHEGKPEYLDSYIDKNRLLIFVDILSEYITLPTYTKETFKEQGELIIDAEEILIDYSPIGHISSFKYHIKPISLVRNREGVALLAYDVKANKPKTFLINRIFDTSKDIIDFTNIKYDNKEKSYVLNFKFLDGRSSLIGIDDLSIKENKNGYYNIVFHNRLSALEFYKKNIFNMQVIDNFEFDDEIKSSLNKVINLIDK